MLECLHNVICMSGSTQLDRQMLVDRAAVKAIIVTSTHNPDKGDIVFTDIAALNNQN